MTGDLSGEFAITLCARCIRLGIARGPPGIEGVVLTLTRRDAVDAGDRVKTFPEDEVVGERVRSFFTLVLRPMEEKKLPRRDFVVLTRAEGPDFMDGVERMPNVRLEEPRIACANWG